MLLLVDSMIEEILEPHPLLRVSHAPAVAKTIVENYVGFSFRAIQWLTSAAVSTKVLFPNISAELMENVAEELGLHTGGIPHLEILKKGCQEMGIDVGKQFYAAPTLRFFSAMEPLFIFAKPIRVAGSVYALEATATKEFDGIDTLFKTYCDYNGIRMSPLLQGYIDHHLAAEKLHTQHLAKAIEPYLGDSEQSEFYGGALDVIHTMNDWFSSFV